MSDLTLKYDYDHLNRVTRVFYPRRHQGSDRLHLGRLARHNPRPRGPQELLRLRRAQAIGADARREWAHASTGLRLERQPGASAGTPKATARVGLTTNRIARQGKQYHDGASEAYVYSQGLLAQTTNARNQTTSYGYDANANLTGIDYPNMPDVTMSYNALDDVTQIVDGVGTHSWNYTPTGRLLSLDGPFAGDTQGYGYDAVGAPEQSQPGARGKRRSAELELRLRCFGTLAEHHVERR